MHTGFRGITLETIAFRRINNSSSTSDDLSKSNWWWRHRPWRRRTSQWKLISFVGLLMCFQKMIFRDNRSNRFVEFSDPVKFFDKSSFVRLFRFLG